MSDGVVGMAGASGVTCEQQSGGTGCVRHPARYARPCSHRGQLGDSRQ